MKLADIMITDKDKILHLRYTAPREKKKNNLPQPQPIRQQYRPRQQPTNSWGGQNYHQKKNNYFGNNGYSRPNSGARYTNPAKPRQNRFSSLSSI